MSENLDAGKTGNFNYSGYYDWEGLYASMASWASKEMYKIYESMFKHKTNGAGFTEREVNWFMEKKIDRMHKYNIKVDIKMWDCQKVDVTENGKTKQMERGRFRIVISADVDWDYQNLFQKGIWKKFWGIYKNIKFNETAVRHIDTLYNKKFDLFTEIKQFLNTDTR